MKTTVRMLSVCLTKEDNRQLEDLCRHYGEARSKVSLRALNKLYYEIFEKVSRETSMEDLKIKIMEKMNYLLC